MSIKVLSILLLFLGEGFAIYAEMIAARNLNLVGRPFLSTFLKMFFVIIIAGGFLIAGYMLGFKSFQNIWIVSAASITSILIIEPILAWTIFQQLPTKGALLGLIFGVLSQIWNIGGIPQIKDWSLFQTKPEPQAPFEIIITPKYINEGQYKDGVDIQLTINKLKENNITSLSLAKSNYILSGYKTGIRRLLS